jgi:hypothetical protein
LEDNFFITILIVYEFNKKKVMTVKRLDIITEEEAEQRGLYTLHEDPLALDVSYARYISLTPHPDPELQRQGWEKVTYYVDRQQNKHMFEPGRGSEWVYVLSNPSFNGMLKIGYTKNAPELRSEQLYKGTGVPTPFKLEFAKQCLNGEMLERLTHKYLKRDRVNNEREFFYTKLDDVVSTINKLHADLEAIDWTI